MRCFLPSVWPERTPNAVLVPPNSSTPAISAQPARQYQAFFWALQEQCQNQRGGQYTSIPLSRGSTGLATLIAAMHADRADRPYLGITPAWRYCRGMPHAMRPVTGTDLGPISRANKPYEQLAAPYERA